MNQFQSFNIVMDGERVRVSCYVGPRGILYTARFEDRVLSLFQSNGLWRTYGHNEKSNNKFKSAIVEWNAIVRHNEANSKME